MVGKLDIGTSNGDYAFDIRAARAAAEGASLSEINSPTPVGPYASVHGSPYWLRTNINTGRVQVGWNIDSDPEADIWRVLTGFLNDSSIVIDYRADVRQKALDLGWDGVS